MPYLVNARHVKTVPGRKSDWNDAQWLQKLHTLGLLQASFRPDAEIVALRTLVRYRAELIQHRAPHIGHMQKALKVMNLQLSEVLTDIVGVTGLAIIRAILGGERDPVRLAQLRMPSCRSSEDVIAKALTGTWKAEQLFVLQHAVALYDAYTAQIAACDAQIEQYLRTMESRGTPDAPLPDLPPAKRDSHSKNGPTFNARAHYARILGVDLVAVMGLSATNVQTIIVEIGTDMSRFPTVKHFCAWLGLAPRTAISGGQVLHAHTPKVTNRATQALRMAAQAVARSDTAFGAYYRTMRARKGPQQATVATAHKIARVIYHLLKYGEPYVEESATAYEAKRQERELHRLTRRAQKLGTPSRPWPNQRRQIREIVRRPGFLSTIDTGTSILLDAQVRGDFVAETALEAVARRAPGRGVPQQITFDRDPRFVGSASARDFPTAFVRFWLCLGVAVNVCLPHHPEQNGFVERYHRTFNEECLRVYQPQTEDQVRSITTHFQRFYNEERPHQGLSCRNQPPRVAFPALPTLPAVPSEVDPDQWLTVLDGRCYTRRVDAHGSVTVADAHYYIRSALRGQSVLLQIDANARAFVVYQQQQVIKRVPIKGLVGQRLAFAQWVEQLSRAARQDHFRQWREQRHARI